MKDTPNSLSLRIDGELQLKQSFTESCLPWTMQVADKDPELLKNDVSFLLMSSKWSFHDKVLVCLFSYFRDDVKRFYESNGPSMDEIFEPHVVARIDGVCSKKLREKFRGIKGAITRAKRKPKSISLEALLGFTTVPRKKG